MTWDYLMHFGVGLGSSFLGALPLGTVNLTVAHTTLQKSFKAALWMSVAAALVEIVHSFVAVHCGMLITDQINASVYTQILSLSIFLALGLYFILKKEGAPKQTKGRYGSDFVKGGLLALINPQAIPFWVFVTTYLQSSGYIKLGFSNVIIFLIGISIGKLLALVLFGVLSKTILSRVKFLNQWANRVIGGVLLIMGVLLAIRYGFI